LCSAGYYCPGGQDDDTPTGYNCTEGHYCPTGSDAPIRCPSGSYQDQLGMAYCKDCPQGFYCDNTMAPVILYNSSYCPMGYYCEVNTTFATENPCPVGTFNNQTHAYGIQFCQPCTGGMY
ncbi:unnamed protein product, partial [Owenia fusiformis]